jgi:hypothetical protein
MYRYFSIDCTEANLLSQEPKNLQAMMFASHTIAAVVAFASLTSSLTYAYVNSPAFVSHTTLRQTSSPFVLPKVRIPAAQTTKLILYATVETTAESGLDEDILSRITDATKESKQWAEDFGLESESGAAFHALFSGIRTAALGVKGKPFHLKSDNVLKAMSLQDDDESDDSTAFDGFFTFHHLEKALEEDFLDADRGSTDNRQGWKVSERI